MTRPLSATYRLQFRNGMTFDRARELVPYLADLGVSHLYASPIFQAGSSSTHGYDVTDPGALDEALGGRVGFERMSDALRAAGIGLIVDIVPNHMAFSLETPWLRDILRNGRDSRYAGHFDIDWSKGRLVLPLLEKPFALMDEEGAFEVAETPGGPVLRWPGMEVPMRRDVDVSGEIADLHAEQHWRLTDWRLERDGLHHRRFFNITSLIGVRVEEPQVFEDVHALLIELVEADRVQGIRIDHVDGLADPGGYLGQLRARIGSTPLWVEKILTGDEPMPDWPVAGTTGYEAGAVLAAAMTDPGGVATLSDAYAARLPEPQEFEAMVIDAKRAILDNELAAEKRALSDLLEACAAEDPVGQDYGPDTLQRALIELCVAMPVYRSYLDGGPVSATDEAMLAHAREVAAEGLVETAPLDFLLALLTGGEGETAARLRVRWQQVTGALMAKAKEDTAFYRFTRLLSANDVGAEPDVTHLAPAAFHEAMQTRLREQPLGLTLTSSHDTKRSEDARMRIAALTHAPASFADLMTVLDGIDGADGVPPHLRWYIGQSLAAIWGDDPDLEPRLREHMQKALREGKEFTTWTHPDEEFESAVLDFAGQAVRRCRGLPHAPAAEALAAADRLILVQAALKFLIPGVPDIYQGCEAPDFSLTDPDNRRAIDFDTLALMADASMASLAARKIALTRACLALRLRAPDLFTTGGYRPIDLPEGMIGFLRHDGSCAVAVVALIGTPPEQPVATPELAGMTRIWGDEHAIAGPDISEIDARALTRTGVLVFARGLAPA